MIPSQQILSLFSITRSIQAILPECWGEVWKEEGDEVGEGEGAEVRLVGGNRFY